MTQYNIFQAILLSFFSKSLYRDVARNWGGKAFLYLLFLMALAVIPLCIQIQAGLNSGYDQFSAKYVTQVPVIKIVNGKVTTPESRPYFIIDPKTHENIAVVDATGQYKTLEQAKTSLLVTQTAIISQSRPNEIKVTELPASLNLVIDPQQVNYYAKEYVGFAWIIFFLAIWIGCFIYRAIQAMLYSILGKIFGAMTNTALTYGQTLQVAMVSITPVIVLTVIFNFFAITFPFQILFYFFLAMIYLFYGVTANKAP